MELFEELSNKQSRSIFVHNKKGLFFLSQKVDSHLSTDPDHAESLHVAERMLLCDWSQELHSSHLGIVFNTFLRQLASPARPMQLTWASRGGGMRHELVDHRCMIACPRIVGGEE